MTAALEDCIWVADAPMLLGTELIREYIPKEDATVVKRLLENGAKILGKAVCENLCHSCTSHSAGTGPIENPLAIGYSSGGSSSGAAALASSGSVDIAIGADQGGSVRIPAAWCGTVGMKPTFGVIPFTASNESTNEHLGIITKNVLTDARALQAINAFVDLFALMTTASFVLSIGPHILTKRKNIVRGSFWLGRWCYAFNIISFLYIIVFFVIYCFPYALPTTVQEELYQCHDLRSYSFGRYMVVYTWQVALRWRSSLHREQQ